MLHYFYKAHFYQKLSLAKLLVSLYLKVKFVDYIKIIKIGSSCTPSIPFLLIEINQYIKAKQLSFTVVY